MCQAQSARLDNIDPGRFEIAGLLSIALATIVGLLAEAWSCWVCFSASTESIFIGEALLTAGGRNETPARIGWTRLA